MKQSDIKGHYELINKFTEGQNHQPIKIKNFKLDSIIMSK